MPGDAIRGGRVGMKPDRRRLRASESPLLQHTGAEARRPQCSTKKSLAVVSQRHHRQLSPIRTRQDGPLPKQATARIRGWGLGSRCARPAAVTRSKPLIAQGGIPPRLRPRGPDGLQAIRASCPCRRPTPAAHHALPGGSRCSAALRAGCERSHHPRHVRAHDTAAARASCAR